MNEIVDLDFTKIQKAVQKQWAAMQSKPLFRVDVTGAQTAEESLRYRIWETYIDAFPAGTNPIFRKRTQHDCACCRNFIRNVGPIVALNDDGTMTSVWDVSTGDDAYDQVCAAMSAFVKSLPIFEPFLTSETRFGNATTIGDYIDGHNERWDHFAVSVDRRFHVSKDRKDSELGLLRTKHQVLLRALREVDADAVDTVLELIEQGSLYRGEEHKHTLLAFKALQDKFSNIGGSAKKTTRAIRNIAQTNFVWAILQQTPGNVSGVRNSAIGTLLVDLSDGKDLEDAVKAFETVVAPSNYRRPKALITKAQIESAQKKVAELGLTSALERRLAVVEDLKLPNILFADRSAKRKINPDAFDGLKATKAPKRNLDKVEEISIEKFIADVLPNVESMEILFEGDKAGNLMTLVAPADPTAGQLFRWSNGFSWAYNGDVADGIKERVKKAGGNVTGDLCCRLAWHNHDDLDLHLRTPRSHIHFGMKREFSTGGQLDVDMNAGAGTTREPVENIFYPDWRNMPNGEYELAVHQYAARERDNVGFEVEIDFLGDVRTFSYPNAIPTGRLVPVADFTINNGKIEWGESLPATRLSRDVWGLSTGEFHKVKLMMLSPNHWEGEQPTGNKHYFFILDGAENPQPVRGFFNEFLDSRLNEHRKVFEALGAKMKTNAGTDQLSGLGFSSTKNDSVTVKVSGSFNRQLKITF